MKGVKRPAPGEAESNGKKAAGRGKGQESAEKEEESEVEQEAVQDNSQSKSRRGGGGKGADADDADVDAKNGSQDEEGKGGASAGGEKDGAADSSQSKRPKEQLDEIPLVVPAAVCKDTKASLLVHLRDETLDFSGDTGAVGRLAVGSKKKGGLLTFDLKGQQFSGQIIPSATVLVVGVGRTEAKVEGLFSEVCRLNYKGNVFDSMGGEVLKGEMDDSYRFEEEDVNARGGGGGGGGDGGAAGAEDGGGGGSSRTPKVARKKSSGKKKGAAKGSSSSSSAKKGTKSSASKK